MLIDQCEEDLYIFRLLVILRIRSCHYRHTFPLQMSYFHVYLTIPKIVLRIVIFHRHPRRSAPLPQCDTEVVAMVTWQLGQTLATFLADARFSRQSCLGICRIRLSPHQS